MSENKAKTGFLGVYVNVSASEDEGDEAFVSNDDKYMSNDEAYVSNESSSSEEHSSSDSKVSVKLTGLAKHKRNNSNITNRESSDGLNIEWIEKCLNYESSPRERRVTNHWTEEETL